MPDTVWATGCDSWHLGKDGLPEVWPCPPGEHRVMLENPDPAHYDLRSFSQAWRRIYTYESTMSIGATFAGHV